MPLLKPQAKQKKSQIRVYLDDQLLEKIGQYCEWAGLDKVDDFLQQAAEFILSKDKDWQTYKESQNKA